MLPGLILALTCAVVTNASFLLRQRGAVESPDVDPRHPLRSLRGLFASRWWTIGWAAAAAAWMLHVGALALLQLSVVQAVVAGGLVFLAVLAERFFGFHLGTRQWVGLSVTAAGLAVLGVTGGPAGPGRGSSLGALIAVEGGVTIISAILIVTSIRLPRVHPAEGMILAVAAGTLFGVSDISLKYLTHAAHAHLLAGIANGWTAAALAASVVAFFASARSLQLGPPLEVIAFTSIAANLVAIGGGILVFHDSIGKGALQITGRMIAFCLVIAGAALMPAPQREREPSAPGVRERRTRRQVAARPTRPMPPGRQPSKIAVVEFTADMLVISTRNSGWAPASSSRGGWRAPESSGPPFRRSYTALWPRGPVGVDGH